LRKISLESFGSFSVCRELWRLRKRAEMFKYDPKQEYIGPEWFKEEARITKKLG